ncbi:integrase core domain-containing protein [Botrimarina mediterranea]|uniref:integrase core domain-containing protein n=1 Tax=Botrimarina mediterranea TaxID=2528022 RepID=UPI00119E1DD3
MSPERKWRSDASVARWVIEWRRLDYNHRRPHSSLGYLLSADLAARWPTSAPGPAEA